MTAESTEVLAHVQKMELLAEKVQEAVLEEYLAKSALARAKASLFNGFAAMVTVGTAVGFGFALWFWIGH